MACILRVDIADTSVYGDIGTGRDILLIIEREDRRTLAKSLFGQDLCGSRYVCQCCCLIKERAIRMALAAAGHRDFQVGIGKTMTGAWLVTTSNPPAGSPARGQSPRKYRVCFLTRTEEIRDHRG